MRGCSGALNLRAHHCGRLVLRHFHDSAGANARGAGAKCFVGAVYEGVHATQVGLPPALRNVVGVRDPVAKVGMLPANFTFRCHKNTS